jgi:hypothetical protein
MVVDWDLRIESLSDGVFALSMMLFGQSPHSEHMQKLTSLYGVAASFSWAKYHPNP